MIDEFALNELRTQIDMFERESEVMHPMDAERRLPCILTPLLEADGYSIKLPRRSQDSGFDYLGEKHTNENAGPFILGIQYKHRSSKRLVELSEVATPMVDAYFKHIDRVLLLANTGFTRKALSAARS